MVSCGCRELSRGLRIVTYLTRVRARSAQLGKQRRGIVRDMLIIQMLKEFSCL